MPQRRICSVANYLLNSIATRLNARPVYTRQSLKQTMQYKHLLCRTSYATAPLMQTPAPAAMPHLLCKHPHQLLCRTCYAKHLLCDAPAAKFPPRTAPFRYAHQNDRTQTQNLSKFRPKFQPKFPTQTHVDFSIEPQHIQS